MKVLGIIIMASNDFPRDDLIYGHEQRKKRREKCCNTTSECLTDSEAVTRCQRGEPIILLILRAGGKSYAKAQERSAKNFTSKIKQLKGMI